MSSLSTGSKIQSMKVRSEHCQCLCTEARVIHSRKDGRQCQHGHSFNWALYPSTFMLLWILCLT